MHLPEVEAQNSLQTKPRAKRPRIRRTRAARACRHCHARKVRCIQSVPNGPCANCRMDGNECVFQTRRNSPFHKYTLPSTDSFQVITPSNEAQPYDQAISSPTSILDEMPLEDLDLHHRDPEPSSPAPTSHGQPTHQSAIDDRQLAFKLAQLQYPFLKLSHISQVSSESVDFLIDRGCLNVPPRRVLDVFVQHYFLYTHPLLPIMNEASFWRMYGSSDAECQSASKDKLSLLVLYGIMFVSCSLLYDLNCEPSAVSVAQAALLLSQSHLTQRSGISHKSGIMWLSIAIYNARKAGADSHDISPSAEKPGPDEVEASANILRRLWWCCIIRDRILPLTARCDVQITRANYDFDHNPMLGLSDLSDEITGSEVYDTRTKSSLLNVLTSLVELCVILTDVLTEATSTSHQTGPANHIEACRDSLIAWHDTLPLQPHEQDYGPENIFLEPHERSTILFANIVHMYYHSSMLALCHHEMLHAENRLCLFDFSLASVEDYRNNQELQHAASQVISCLGELVRLDLALTMYRSQYESAEWVAQALQSIVKVFDEPTLPARITSESFQLNTSVKSWTDIARLSPRLYLRLATMMDLAIRNGSLPDENDLPLNLRAGSGVVNPCPAPASSNPQDDTHEAVDFCAGALHSSGWQDPTAWAAEGTGCEFMMGVWNGTSSESDQGVVFGLKLDEYPSPSSDESDHERSPPENDKRETTEREILRLLYLEDEDNSLSGTSVKKMSMHMDNALSSPNYIVQIESLLDLN
ncbi:hypothetical protein FSARC_517 [Fusarium sarcochroum]|uniref:Zn(2)-C6 fungal-type domain-containing protein n=1 Tax=Fusarium sarcochroum TaxID=1208366 RepID=A0A8H4UAX2_9HYPO|nr:hypothetical protein FSARC_517 [Fusarium sarcochroum]